jgi:peptidylprolyl isomerase
MKKSEKVKGKEKIATRKQKYLQFGIIAAVICIIAAISLVVLFNPFVAKNGDIIQIYYTGSLDDGTVFYSNVNSSPVVFKLGDHTVIPGLEEAILGMNVNQVKTVYIPYDKAYGHHRPELVRVVNRSRFPSNITPEVGTLFSIRQTSTGATSVVKILNVTSSTVTWDENHLLAGKNLTFEIKLAGFSSGTQ